MREALKRLTALEACYDEVARVTRQGGTLYLSVPRSAAFDDRLYRFTGYFRQVRPDEVGKRIEHHQRFDLAKLVGLFCSRGFELVSLSLVPASFS